jgi:hypothetical protein
MTDPIQSGSSIPLPIYQTLQGRLDPLPVTGPEQTTRSDNARADERTLTTRQDFETYLNQTSITNLLRSANSTNFDPVQDIVGKSVYKHRVDSQPI